ncbi:VOC family protein [Cupriavidus consociatus]|uniref:VOC family protein n=1 Tax=Cupriavidus consociatus TaxID=2821357 RepID=UPI001AE9D4A5|nr:MULTISPECIES: VOC family protein [unclassified Cupriavidus]MBP0623098.1 VOC family protein [Cupriavidus sp. LEh25]MDK2659789.1 VOC family protein [Cupriavidus sp. LEh21]
MMAALPKTHFRHTGIFAFDPDLLARFYSRWFGLVVSDLGTAKAGHHVIFMTGDPEEHHQIVFASGRKPEWPGANQLSFTVESLSDLKRLAIAFHEAGVSILQQKDHGNTWSLYVADPEGNRIEVYTPTEWYVSQPTWWELDLVTESEEAIRARTQASVQAQPGYMTREEWMAHIQARIEAQRSA